MATKRLVPTTPSYLIIRKRLLDVLDAGVQGSVTLLSAPAGSGKTVLLASWLQTRRMLGPVCWLSLDADDNDASRFAADLLCALRDGHVIRRGSALDRITLPIGARTDRFLPSLVNALCKLRSPFVLVLDDAHELTSPQAGAIVDFLVRHAPEQCHLVIAGRTDPPMPIERLRLSGVLTELRVGDLAFDRTEASALYRQFGVELSEMQLDVLLRRTEGWAAALRLAGLSLQSHPEPERFVTDFAGTDRAIADYLVSEVLASFPADRRDFVLRTCLVETINAELADALTGLGGGALTLASLEHCGAPVQRARADETSYRYHPLFAELLRAHLRHAHPEEVSLLHRRAARWYAQQGQSEPAIRHALAGEDWDLAASTIGESWLELFMSGASGPMRELMSRLPEEVIVAHPLLAAAFAGSRLEDGDADQAQRYLSLAQAEHNRLQGASRRRLQRSLAAVGLVAARLQSDAAEVERCAEELSALAGPSTYSDWAPLRSFALSNLGATLLWCGETNAAALPLEEALALASEAACERIMLDCLAQLAVLGLHDGQIERGAEYSALALELAERPGWDEGPGAACAYLAGSGIAYWRGEFERAEGLASSATSAALTAELPVRLAIRIVQALALAAAGERSAEKAMLKLQAARVAMADGDRIPAWLRLAFEDTEPRVMLAAGEGENARTRLAEARELFPESTSLRVRHASVELFLGEHENARKSLTAVLCDRRAAAAQDRAMHPVLRLEAVLLQALLEHSSGDQDLSAQVLEDALAIAERERTYGPLLLCAPQMPKLLERHAVRGTAHPALLETILDSVEGGGSAPAESTIAEPLTERELRILRYLPTMLTNAEIGAEIYVSLNTVKTHLRSIYRKLDASSRAQAVDRARALGLLPHGIRRPRVVHRSAKSRPTRIGGRADPRLRA